MEHSRHMKHWKVAAALGAALSARLLCADDLSFKAGALTAEGINGYLAKKHYKAKASPLNSSGQAFLAAGQKFDIDPALIVAISGQETSFATRTCTTDNAWNWFWQGPCPRSPFDNYEQGINTVSKFLRKNYINRGYNTIPLIRKKYCTAPVKNGIVCPGWITNVTLFRDQLKGLPIPAPAPGQPAEPGAPTSSSKPYLWIIAAAIAVLLALGGWLLGRRSRPA